MDANTVNSKKYAAAYAYACDLLEAKHPNWGDDRISVAANLYVSVMLAIAVTDAWQEQTKEYFS